MRSLLKSSLLSLVLALTALSLNASISFNDLQAKKSSNFKAVNRVPNSEQAKAITNFFLSLGNKTPADIRITIDNMVKGKQIVREQAEILNSYLAENLIDFAPKPANFNLKPIPRGEPGNEDMAKSYIWIAQQNRIIINDEKNRAALNYKVFSKKYNYNQIPPLKGGNETTVLELRDQDSVDAAEELAQKGMKTALLNFANKDHFCGGYLTGQLAQEEDICRRTTLFPVLNNIKGEYPIAHNQLIYSSDIKIFRKNWSTGFALLQVPVAINVITIAAYNLNQKMNPNDSQISDEKYKEGTKEKIKAILRIAGNQGNQAIVLGAFGLGVFAQNAKKPLTEIAAMVASLFREVLSEPEFQGVFKVIRFAILGPTSINHTTFRKELSQVKNAKLRNDVR